MNPGRVRRHERGRIMLRRRVSGAALLLFFFLAAIPCLWAQERKIPEGPVHIEADGLAYDGDEDAYRATGNAVITFTGGFLKADSVTFYRTTSQALAEGHVLLKSEQDIIEGQRVSFNIVSKTGVVDDGKMFIAQNHFYVKGDRIEKTGEATYRLENAKVTSCDGDKPDWSLTGRELEVTIDGYGTMKQGNFLARDVPVLYFPYLIFPAKTTRQSGLLFPQFSFSRDKNGLDVEVPFYWAISESSDATFYQRYMERRGFKEGVEYRYQLSPTSFGTFYADFLNDKKHVAETVGALSRDWQEDQKRWSYYLNHETTFSPGFYVRSDIRRVSDDWYFKDFSTYNYYLDNYSQTGIGDPFRRVSFLGDESIASLDSTVRLVKDWPLYNLTAVARYTDDFAAPNNDATLQKYPEITLTGFRRPLAGSPLQLDFTSVYDHFYRQEGQKGHLWEINPTLYWPTKLGPYVQVTPQAGFRGSVWDRSDSLTDAGDKHGEREVFQTGATLSTEISRVFNIGGATVDKVMHTIRPEITYAYIPDASQGFLPDFLPAIPPQHSLTYAVTNTVISRSKGKDGKASYREMMRLKLAQTFDVLESRRDVAAGTGDNRPLSGVTMELDLAPVPYFSLAARNIYSVNSGNWTQSNYDMTVSDNRGDAATVGYRYTRDALEEVNLVLKAALTSEITAGYMLKRNLLGRSTVESVYGVKYRKQCWILEVNVSNHEEDLRFMVYFSLMGMGSNTRGGAFF